MCRAFFIVCCFLLIGVNSRAQENWADGYIELVNGKSFRGACAVKLDHNVVLYKVGDEVMVFPAHKVSFARVYDHEDELLHSFVSLQMERGASTVFELYELLVDGEIKVLRREQVDWYASYLDVMEYDYFLWQNNMLTDLFRFKRKVYPELVKQSDGKLKRFAKENRLNPAKLEDIIRLVAFYNTDESVQISELAKQ